jgi:hypothetical protein
MAGHERDGSGFKKGIGTVLLALTVLLSLYSLWTSYTIYTDERPTSRLWQSGPSCSHRDGEERLNNTRTLTSKYGPPFNALEELHYALETMQSEYFQIWLGKWPTSIDWTGAVLGTLVSASLFSLTRSLDYVLPPTKQQSNWATIEGEKVENEINRYFSQSIAYYFGEDAFQIRLEAYDDMLWVVLGWLESIRFVKLHSNTHYPSEEELGLGAGKPWYGNQFVPSFAHRANIFYEIANQGWDNKLCGGGMVWNPRLTPYKNAITNQLYISASIGMYLYFPGDRNPSPFLQSRKQDPRVRENGATDSRTRPHDPVYLSNAVQAYDWLKNSNMTNEKGLYVDGFHIAGWSHNGSIGTGNCDVRNEMVYTYNQGVLLSGLRSLWESTGKLEYLEDGHKLVRNVIAATGWRSSTERTRWWSGLGRNGILEEICDSSGTCSQNGQTFKGIFFHHLTLFCEPLPQIPLIPGKTYFADPTSYSLHAQSCKEYNTWVIWNARAAMSTRDSNGRFGMWWGVPNWDAGSSPEIPEGAEDYRNEGLGSENRWGSGWREGLGIIPPHFGSDDWPAAEELSQVEHVIYSSSHVDLKKRHESPRDIDFPANSGSTADLNDRGRGRTVETQGGGVAVLRAFWEFVHVYSD